MSVKGGKKMNEKNLSTKSCKPCGGDEKPLSEAEIADHLHSLAGWALTKEKTLLFREYKMKNFMEAVDFINKIARIAEEQGHHPDLHLVNYKFLRIDLSTHAIGGLSLNDFIMAAKINKLT
jgi:4a-hydroxytetrahydrobiopterin dehydratase